MKTINESYFNFFIRTLRYIRMRLTGLFFSKFMAFKKPPKRMLIGKNFRTRDTKLVNIGNRIKIGDNCRIECYGTIPSNDHLKTRLLIGDDVNIGNNVHIGTIGEISIGKNCLFGSNILLIDHNHGSLKNIEERLNLPPKERDLIYTGAIIVEENVWLCDDVIVLGGSTIKKGSVVPAKSVINGYFDNTIKSKTNEQ